MFDIKVDEIERGKVDYLRIKYSTDSDILLVKFREGIPFDSVDVAEGLIAHYGKDGKLLEVEVLDASKFPVASHIYTFFIYAPKSVCSKTKRGGG